MKKIIAITLLCLLLLCACGTQLTEDMLTGRTFHFSESDDLCKPNVSFQEGGRFTMTHGSLSSYFGRGNYIIRGNNVICTTEDTEQTYIFRINPDSIVYDEENSAGFMTFDFTPVTDGTVFSELEIKTTE